MYVCFLLEDLLHWLLPERPLWTAVVGVETERGVEKERGGMRETERETERERARETRIESIHLQHDSEPGPCVSLFYVNDIGSTGSRGRTVRIPCVYPSP